MKPAVKLTLVPILAMSALAPMPALAEPFRLILTHLEPPLVPNSVMDLALELGADDADLAQNVRALALREDLAVLMFGEHPRHRDHRQGENGRDVRCPEYRARRLSASLESDAHDATCYLFSSREADIFCTILPRTD